MEFQRDSDEIVMKLKSKYLKAADRTLQNAPWNSTTSNNRISLAPTGPEAPKYQILMNFDEISMQFDGIPIEFYVMYVKVPKSDEMLMKC